MLVTLSTSPSGKQEVSAVNPLAQVAEQSEAVNATYRLLSHSQSLNPIIQQVLANIKLTQKPVDSDRTLSLLWQQAKSYIGSFQYRPLETITNSDATYKTPLNYSFDDTTLESITNLVLEAVIDLKIAPQVLERVLFKPEVLGKLAVIYEHGFMVGTNKPEEKAQLIRKLIRQFTSDDSAMRFIREELPFIKTSGEEHIDVYKLLMSDPSLYARAVITHRWVCREHGIDPYDVDKQREFTRGNNLITDTLLKLIKNDPQHLSLRLMTANLRKDAPIKWDPIITIGETVFFKPLLDDKTLSPIQFLLDAFERGINNVEISADLLPFDPTKRLAGEYTDDELIRIRELAKQLNLSLTVHSPIVGPLHPKTKFTELLEDAADNVQVMKDTVDFAAKLGAKTVVVHISDRNSNEAIKRYAEIASHAVGKHSIDGTPLRVSFENYMSKALPDGTRPFPTMKEHFLPFAKIIKEIVTNAVHTKQNPVAALQHVALLLDFAHFNLVLNMEDPLKAALEVTELAEGLAKELLTDKELGPQLLANGFNARRFVNNLISELHLNQNIGPIAFTIPGKDYNADIHNPVDSRGSLDIVGLVALIEDAGFGDGLILLAEQIKYLSSGGLQMLYNAAKDCPGITLPLGQEKINYFIEKGITVINSLKAHKPAEYNKIKGLLEVNPNKNDGNVHPYYAYLVGRFGIEHLKDHLYRRVSHMLFSARFEPPNLQDLDLLPVDNIALQHYAPSTLIIQKGTTYNQACEEGTNWFYFIAQGTVVIEQANGKTIELTPGMPFGEAMYLKGTERNANVKAGPDGATLVKISEDDFWRMFKELVPFQERVGMRRVAK